MGVNGFQRLLRLQGLRVLKGLGKQGSVFDRVVNVLGSVLVFVAWVSESPSLPLNPKPTRTQLRNFESLANGSYSWGSK